MSSCTLDLTVITAVYNGEEFIAETVDSVLRCAKGTEFEYLVINDGSTDRTQEILQSYGSKIRVISQTNAGESAAVNVGIREAKGLCCLVVSADDPLLTETLFAETIDAFRDNAKLAAVYPDWQMIDQKGQVIKEIIVPDYSDELLIGRCRTLPGPGVLFRASFAQALDGRRSRWTYVGDYDFWLRLSRVGEIRRRPGVRAQWRYHPNSTSVTKRGPKMAIERIEVVEEFLAKNYVAPDLARMARGTSYYMAARLGFFSSEIPSRSYLFQAFRERKKWVEESQFQVLIYILLLPLSRILVNPILSRSKRYRTLI
jgi:glycosyltransferase involved in cell wall biosynthesis